MKGRVLLRLDFLLRHRAALQMLPILFAECYKYLTQNLQ